MKSDHETKVATNYNTNTGDGKVEQEEYVLVLLSSSLEDVAEYAIPAATNKMSEGANMFLVPASKIDANVRKVLKSSRTAYPMKDEDEDAWEAVLEMFQPYYVKPQVGGKSSFGPPRLVVDTIHGYY